MRAYEKMVRWNELKPDMKVHFIEHSEGTTFDWHDYVVSANATFVKLADKPSYYDDDEKTFATYYSEDTMFCVDKTEEEREAAVEQYYDAIYDALNRELKEWEIGEHTMWNGWIGINMLEFAENMIEHEITIVGVCHSIEPRHTWSGEWFDVGICAIDNYDPENPFWCHFKQDWLDDVKKDYQKYMRGKE